jgi:hypothetical protein
MDRPQKARLKAAGCLSCDGGACAEGLLPAASNNPAWTAEHDSYLRRAVHSPHLIAKRFDNVGCRRLQIGQS